MNPSVSIILPAKNEAATLPGLLEQIKREQPDAEVIVVDDGSNDATRQVCIEAGVICLSSPYSMGNGAAVKRGARQARGEFLVFMDADGQHDPQQIQQLIARMNDGYDMIVGARDSSGQANWYRGLANAFYNALSSWMTGQKILDLTSGFRVVRAEKFREFLHLLPNGFSYPTTCTMAFFRSAYSVGYEVVQVQQRIGTESHVRPLRDGVRFLLIIFKVASLYSPLKLFLPISSLFFALGIGNYAYTYITVGRFTNMSALLLSAAVIIFLVGLVSEQITSLMYAKN